MKIVKIKEKPVPIKSDIRNAYIDFSKMTASVIAIITDVFKNGERVIGYGFHSNGRYAPSGLLHERFIPRLLQADPTEILNDDGSNFDPHRIWDILMTGEKPGGHGERSVAVGTIDMAVWDAVAKIEEKPLYQLLADRYRNGEVDEKVFVYAAGGYYSPNKDLSKLQEEMQRYLDQGYSVVKMKIGGDFLEEDLRRIEAVLDVVPDGQSLAVDANGRFDLETAITYAEKLEPYNLFWYEEAGDPLDFELQANLPNIIKTQWQQEKTSFLCKMHATL
ncbi:enolase C-terminal domain-like protein [Alteribacillus sp. JSM 102045]|uniref:enolase C-terminal domain-like protein n=1 Tax=Alteribacillus sp. JSM 102045 TaxID=1562101 RepID=UPI0035BF12BA